MDFGWQGQSCNSTSRLIVHDSIHEEVPEWVTELVRAIRVGDPSNEASQIDSINPGRHYEKVLFYNTARARARGPSREAGGASPRESSRSVLSR